MSIENTPDWRFVAGRLASVLRELTARGASANRFVKADAAEALALFDIADGPQTQAGRRAAMTAAAQYEAARLPGVSGSMLFRWLADGRKRCLCCGAPVPAGESCPCQADTFTPCPQCGAPKPVGRPCPCIPTA